MHFLEARSQCVRPPLFAWLVLAFAGSLPIASAQSFYINCGGNAYTTTDGTVWAGDRNFTGGANYWTSQNIANTPDSWLYRSARYSLYGDFAYDFVVANGSYKIKLRFSENHYWGSGYRIFHVDINGTRYLANFDIAAAAGGARIAVDREFTVNVTSGRIHIDFTGVKEKGMVSAIEVTPAGASTPSAPTTPVSLSVAPQNPTVSQGASQAFTSTVAGSTNTQVSWSVIGSAPAGAINSSGVYTAPTGLSASKTVTVTATSLADPTKSASSMVTIAGPAAPPPVVSVTVSPSSASVISGNTAQFSASVSGTSNPAVTWTASAGSISAAGLFTAPSVSGATQVTVTARAVADTTKTAMASVTVNPVAVPSTGAWIESNGLLSIEAENGKIVNRAQSWNFRSDVGGYSGSGFLAAEPNSGNLIGTGYVGVAPEVQFLARFTRAGTYQIWIRGYGQTDVDDSVHVGLNGSAQTTGETISQFPFSPPSWAWSNVAMDYIRRSTIVVPAPGLHTINVWMREDGFRLDKIVLSADSGYTASGFGPAESAREVASTGGPALSLSTTSLTFNTLTGNGNTAPQTVNVSNSGTGTMNWSASSTQAWVKVTPGSGTNAGSLSITADITGLTAGSRNGSVIVTAPGASNSPQTINVALNLTAPVGPSAPTAPTISMSLSQTSLSLSGVGGTSTAASQTVGVSFSGGSPAWAVGKNQSWLSVSPASGTGNATLTIAANPSGLGAGTYTDVISVTAPGALNSPGYINVSFTVQSAPATSTSGRNFYVATNGSASNNGSIGSPWTFPAAMAATSTIKPGDTIWIRGGVYGNGKDVLNVRFLGTEAQPILIRGYPGERATVQHPLIIGCCDGAGNPSAGQHMWFWGLEFTSPITDRTGCPSGPPCYASSNINPAMHVFAPGARIINSVIHDTMQGISLWTEAINGEAYGNVIYHNGFHASDRGHGHGIYTQNNTGVKKLRENIVFNQFGWGLHLYGSGSAWVRNFLVEGNISFNNGSPEGGRTDNIIVAGGQGGGAGIVVKDNHFYMTPESQMGYNEVGWLWSTTNEDASVTDNYFIGGRDAFDMFAYKKATFTGNTLYSISNLLWLETPFGTSQYNWNNNRYYGISSVRYNGSVVSYPSFKSATKFDSASTYTTAAPTGVWSFVRPNRCEAGRGNVVIYNWDQAASVSVSLSTVLSPGMAFEIRDAQNFYKGPVVSGGYTGAPVAIPMTGLTLAAPNGVFPYIPPHTAPKFGTFVVVVPGSTSRTC